MHYYNLCHGAYLKEKASRQQTTNIVISPKRGAIYDTNGKAFAMSASVDTISINPSKISKDDKEKVANILAEIFELEYEGVLEQVNSDSPIQVIAKKVEQDKVEQLKTWMEENKIAVGINIDSDTKRYYPYNNLASNLIGFTGTDNQGLAGIESKWDDTLTGTAGKIVTTKDVNGDQISDESQIYVEAENGNDIYLTIDVNIQTIIEKHLEEGVKNNHCDSGCAIIMKPDTGEILSMATYPNYNLNTPFTPNTDTLTSNWDNMTGAEKNDILQKMWRNKVVSDTYEPGSTFKLLIAAVALEENIIKTDVSNDFHCIGYETINGAPIACWTSGSHGYQSLRDALKNSCNPAFIQLGQKIGTNTLYKYFSAFGLFSKTNIATTGEALSVFHNIENIRQTELATISFGQRFNITPLQLITAVSSLANEGVLVQPKIVKQVVNSDTGAITLVDTTEVRQVVSKETSQKILDMMESVVTDGTGQYGAVAGYSIGGKTGTSEPAPGKEEEGYIVSYVAVAPAENPEIVALVVLYNPGGSNPQGSKVAGPVMSKMLTEVLPYLGISSVNATVEASSTIEIPNIKNKTVAEAKKILSNLGFNVSVSVTGDENSILVTDQVPSPNILLAKDSTVVLYTEENTIRTSVPVPDLTGMSLSQAKNTLKLKNLNITYSGSGLVFSQNIQSGTSVETGTIINVTLAY